ncbi:hypothetical protein [Hymenobacter psychrophilus]|uniref:Uncharacterized protein n=1 Tax=Hymenobacter psychrophilus TaxID=651662 RepID=A0A1H3PDP5_9BACT|nr:hypothetical protein [Hymenobacter psychrophilus]SDY99274.1 hypothetical protein SAMN04488069_12914 [Hymenobacter psychrophilus]
MNTTSLSYQYAKAAGRVCALRQVRAELQAAMAAEEACLPTAAYRCLDALEARLNAEKEAMQDAISRYPPATDEPVPAYHVSYVAEAA